MFCITCNKFFERGIVKYENERKDRVMVRSTKDGKEFKVKVRFYDTALTMETMTFAFPYEIEGFHAQINKTFPVSEKEAYSDILNQEFEQTKCEYVMPVLCEVSEIVMRWISISLLLIQFDSDNMKWMAAITGMTDNNVSVSYKNILEELEKYQEMEQIVAIYRQYIAI